MNNTKQKMVSFAPHKNRFILKMIKPLTSLRFIFAFMVFMSHKNIFLDNEGSFLWHIFYEGYAGVSFFFMLSGFILAYSYQQRLSERTISARSFYVARIARIYPLHLLSLLVAIYLTRFFEHINLQVLVDLGLNTFLLHSFMPGQEFGFNAVSWSLSDEAFFYALFPFIILALPRMSARTIGILCAGVASIIIATAFVIQDSPWENWVMYINPVFRLFDFVLGILLYNLCTHLRLPQKPILYTGMEAGAILLVVASYSLAYFIPFSFRQSVWYWIPMGLLIATFYFQRGKISQFLSHHIFVKLGEISFAFYLFHYLTIQLMRIVVLKLGLNIAPIPEFLIALVASTAIAYCAHQYIEKPANRFIRNRFS